MKTVILGDIHGRDIWKKIIITENPDRVIFIGDYWDSFDVPFEKQLNNFMDIIEYKNDHDVILLLGNHDYHYLDGVEGKYSGYQEWQSHVINRVLTNNLDKFQICHIQEDIVFTHAGITNTYLGKLGWTGEEPLDLFLNEYFKYSRSAFEFYYGDRSGYGDHIAQGPLWVRPQSLVEDRYDRIQVVGHTGVKHINITDTGIVLIDTLGNSQEYLILNDKTLLVGRATQ